MAAKVRKPKVQRIKFSKEDLYEEYFEEMKCIACVSTFQPFQFAHTLNMMLDKNFRHEVELMNDEAGKKYKIFFDHDAVRSIDYHIICNRNRTDFLIPELPNSDFLILMNGMSLHPELLGQTLEKLQGHNKITYSYEFDPFQLKSKEYLIL